MFVPTPIRTGRLGGKDRQILRSDLMSLAEPPVAGAGGLCRANVVDAASSRFTLVCWTVAGALLSHASKLVTGYDILGSGYLRIGVLNSCAR